METNNEHLPQPQGRFPLLKTYAALTPSVAGAFAVQELRQAFSDLHRLVELYVPGGRLRAMALTDLEKASCIAIKGAIHDDPESIETQEGSVEGIVPLQDIEAVPDEALVSLLLKRYEEGYELANQQGRRDLVAIHSDLSNILWRLQNPMKDNQDNE
jgi:hypothetical protein